MDALTHPIRALIEQWTPPDPGAGAGDDPLAIQLDHHPAYLPVLQSKCWHSHFGAHRQARRVLGLDGSGRWVEDGRANGQIARVLGTGLEPLAMAAFSLGPLRRARSLYPDLADLIWDPLQVAARERTWLQQWDAVVAAARSEPTAAQEGLLDLVNDELFSALVRLSGTFGRFETPALVAALRQALDSPSLLVRSAGAWGLRLTTPGQGFDAWLLDQVADPQPAVRQMVACALGQIGSDTAQEPLQRYLRDQPVVQQEAIDALVALENPTSRPAILSLAADWSAHPVEQGQARALMALQAFWHDEDAALLLRALQAKAAAVRGAAAYTLGEQRIVAAIPDVRRALWDPEPEVRTHAGYALVKLGDVGMAARVTELATNGVEWFTDPLSGSLESEQTLMAMLRDEMAKVKSAISPSSLS
jgi:HEAT repeat protein